MKVIIINGSARKGNTLTAIEAFVKGASEKIAYELQITCTVRTVYENLKYKR